MANINRENKFRSTNNNFMNGSTINANDVRIASGPGIKNNGQINVQGNNSGREAPPKVNANDPKVRKLVYNMYRGMLSNKHEKANEFIDTLPKYKVDEDKGVTHRVDRMM